MLPPLRALVAFEAVARLGSIGAAARELCVTQAAVSQQLKSLETFLDTTLFERSSKGVKLTSAAQHYQPIVAGSLAHLKLQTQILFGEKETDVLSLRVNHTFCHNWLLPRLPSFYQKYPFIRLDIQLVDWPSTNPCQNVDIELTNGKVESEDTHSERLFQEHWQLVCSPEFKKQYQDALVEHDFSALPTVQVKGYRENWLQWLSHNQFEMTLPKVLLEVSNSLHALEAVKHGIGVLLVRSLAVSELLEKNDLVLATESSMPAESAHYLITKHRRSAKVNFFCDWLYHHMEDGELEERFSNG
ncbi:LysR substrate-binding domain-containing protein [Vibrio lentus]|uniref:LysR family transcriptional regulator n=1 Tax=Vibrio lentus TaxID=136468 RepID=A0A855IXL0_9VIBR|nr:LysR substrate-binding domain-containing protein [Vibrio lentus]PMJ60031.1 LysR family transcriptional regulator [Vibrio lentus]PMJ84442.1 LysR family transcriptional regulator [Vibrio lentus]PMM52693.1 LysR family transcriptional regulator [Vibrio lentus]PMM63157.1 LysR family transcriptional regulator [Vibrio lentus]PMN40040.1 LysR family transcriptional regulator [Vibrio lentus]